MPSILPAVTMAPTRSSFLASWKPAGGATGYRIDVSTSRSFDSYVTGYRNLDVGNVTNRIVSRLKSGTTYYYRVRAYNALSGGSDSETMTSTTATSSGLVINPTFDSSITGNANAAAIESMINQAIALYQPLFSDPITIEIRFRYADTQPDGTRPAPRTYPARQTVERMTLHRLVALPIAAALVVTPVLATPAFAAHSSHHTSTHERAARVRPAPFTAVGTLTAVDPVAGTVWADPTMAL